MLISLEDITIRVGERHFFEHTSWVLPRNEHWAIIGPTGSGKSILAGAICRQFPLFHGKIRYFFDVNHPAEGRPYLNPREILTLSPAIHHAFIKQYAGYHQARWASLDEEDLPCARDLLTSESIEHRSPFETTPLVVDEETYRQRREAAIQLFNLDYLLDRKITHLSHGESRKLLISRLLMQNPRLLILDDPFAGLDQNSRAIFTQAIQNLLNQAEIQVLLISARIEEIPENIQNLLVVNQGKIIAHGTRTELLQKPDCSPILTPLEHASPCFSLSNDFKRMVKTYTQAVKNNPVLKHPALVEMNHTRVSYQQVAVLENIDWSIKLGERWMLSGHNGAGKTTLLSLILADNPQAYANNLTLFGHIRGSGETIWDIKQNIGWVSPELHIYYPSNATSLEVVCSGFFDSVGLFKNCTAAQMTGAKNWLNALGLSDYSDLPFFSLSSGQQRLVLLARALVKNPPLLVLDEPCQRLDDANRKYFIELLDHICAATPIALVYVTHSTEESPACITHQLKLDHGQIIEKKRVFYSPK